MIDELTDPALEQRLRATLGEMIPKLLDATDRTTGEDVTEAADANRASGLEEVSIVSLRHLARPRRRFVAASLLTGAAVVAMAISVRQPPADPDTPGSTGSSALAIPEQSRAYRTWRGLIPQRFEYLAWIGPGQLVAVDVDDGKSLEVALSDSFPDEGVVANFHGTEGRWTDVGNGWRVVAPAGFGVEIRCSIGGLGTVPSSRYCEMDSTGAFTAEDVQVMAGLILNSMVAEGGVEVFDAMLRNSAELSFPSSARATAVLGASAEALVRQAFPSRAMPSATEVNGPVDVLQYTDPAVGGVDLELQAVRTSYAVGANGGHWAFYDDAAARWFVRSDGVALRVSSADTQPDTLTRLTSLVNSILGTEFEPFPPPAPPNTAPTEESTLAPVDTAVPAVTSNPSLPDVPEAPASRLLPTDMQGIDDVVTEFTSAEATGMTTIRQFVGGGVNPAVLLLIWSPSGSESAADIARGTWDATERASWPSFRRTVAGPAGQDVMVAAGGLPQDQFDAVADSLRVDPATSAVTIDGSLAGLTELTMLDTPALGYRASWSAGVEMTAQSGYGLDVLGAALSWPVTRIETDRGVLFAATDALDPTAVQVGGVVDGVAVNLSTAGLSQEQAIAMARSITPMSDAEWSRRVPGFSCIATVPCG